MSEFKLTKSNNYDTKTLDNSEKAIEDLTEKWYTLDSSFNSLIDDDNNYSSSNNRRNFINDDSVVNFFNEFYKSLGKVEAAEEVKKNNEKLYDMALMRPVHLSVGVMLLSVLIYELYSR
tara:strand:+ start:1317 stop:1673 length:357 start_codon:yes stop_codon:yes gene_type:complete